MPLSSTKTNLKYVLNASEIMTALVHDCPLTTIEVELDTGGTTVFQNLDGLSFRNVFKVLL